MIRVGYAPGAFDLFHIGHLSLLRRAKEHCDFLIAGVVADEVIVQHKNTTPVIPFSERLEIVRNVRFVDMAHAAMTNDKIAIWNELRFNVVFKGDDWRGTEKGEKLERDLAALGVEVIYFSYTQATSSSTLRRALQNIDTMVSRASLIARGAELARALKTEAVRGPTGVGSPSRFPDASTFEQSNLKASSGA